MKRTFEVSAQDESMKIVVKGTLESDGSYTRDEVTTLQRKLASAIMQELATVPYVRVSLADVKVRV